ncbi:MAG: protease modulator HflC [Oligoflexales bacterium]
MKIFLSTVTLATIFLLFSSTYIVEEGQQALVVQFKDIHGEAITEPGLRFKIPFIQSVIYLEKRIQQIDSNPEDVPTRDKKFVHVATTARWKIKDPAKFYRAIKNLATARLRMKTILEGTTKETISSYNLIETVRNSNAILEQHTTSATQARPNRDENISGQIETVQIGREKLANIIADHTSQKLEDFGIELIDVQIRSIALKKVVEEKVYSRMISERQRIASEIRSYGKAEEARILGRLELSLKRVNSEAYRKSQEIRGRAEAEAIETYASALSKDPDYFEFKRSLEVYRKTLTKNGEFILSTDTPFLKYLKQAP